MKQQTDFSFRMLRPVFRSFNRLVMTSRTFASQSSSDDGDDLSKKLKSVKDKDAIDERLLKAVSSAVREKHPKDKGAQAK